MILHGRRRHTRSWRSIRQEPFVYTHAVVIPRHERVHGPGNILAKIKIELVLKHDEKTRFPLTG